MTAGDGRPDDPRSGEADDESLLTRFRTAESGPLMFLREVLTSVAAVALIGLLLFAISGVWPPMVAVESPSMDPHMQKGDLVFVTEPGRFIPGYAHGGTGVVTAERGAAHDYRTFEGYGSVIIYRAPDRAGPPIIHRAMFWVDRGENWYDRANPAYVQGDSCSEIPRCPAPHAGFITKGDNNPHYDQVSHIATVVKPDWVIGVAHVRIPYLGWIRLAMSGVVLEGPAVGTAVATPVATTPATTAPVAATPATIEQRNTSQTTSSTTTSQPPTTPTTAIPTTATPTTATSTTATPTTSTAATPPPTTPAATGTTRTGGLVAA